MLFDDLDYIVRYSPTQYVDNLFWFALFCFIRIIRP